MLRGDIYDLPLKSACTDLVLCTEVLEHVFETRRALSEVYRILKKGGLLVLSTPLIMGEHETHDYYRFTLECLKVHVREIGFEVVDVQTRGGIFSALGLLLTHLPRQLVRNRLPSNDGTSGQRKVYTFVIVLMLPFIMIFQYALRIFTVLDRLDKKKRFTLGYVLLCSKTLSSRLEYDHLSSSARSLV